MPKKTREMLVFGRKWSFFSINWPVREKWRNLATDPLRGSQCHVVQNVPFPSPTGFSEAMDGHGWSMTMTIWQRTHYVGPNPDGDQQEDVMYNSLPPWSKTIYTVYNDKTLYSD